MDQKIKRLLAKNPGLKAKEIATELQGDSSEVNSCLYRNKMSFYRNDEFKWYLIEDAELKINFVDKGQWIDCRHFEQALLTHGSPLDWKELRVIFDISDSKSIMLAAAAKLLSLCNQLNNSGKTVFLDFKRNKSAVTYLDRAGFFDRLAPPIIVLPSRPNSSAAKTYNNNSLKLVELHEIGKTQSENIPQRLKNSLIANTGTDYANAVFTIIAELVSNVEEHSGTNLPGVAGLQCYSIESGKPRKVQAVVSDSGLGISGTLRPVLKKKYPQIDAKLNMSKPDAEPRLIVEALINGGITKKDGDGGAGLKISGKSAAKLDASINIRQETFELKLVYSNGELEPPTWELNMPRFSGTHVVFNFNLKNTVKSA